MTSTLILPGNSNYNIRSPANPVVTTLDNEYNLAKAKVISLTRTADTWDKLLPYQKLCFALVEKFTLNEEQTLAFLLFADHHAHQVPPCFPPIRMMLGGPGGAGKSQVFDAISEFYKQLDQSYQLKITAPTGLAANNVGGTTTHSEASLRVKRSRMCADNKQGQTLRSNLEQRFNGCTAMITDEIYFLGADDNALLSQNLCIARHVNDDASVYGNLNVLFAGDPAQLPPPMATSLYDHTLVKCYESKSLNGLNEKTKHNVEGIIIWHQVNTCVMLKTIMRQKDPIFQALLGRLRYGLCTMDDYIFLKSFIIMNRDPETNNQLLNITCWITNRSFASPLICYTNIVRDAHNVKAAEAFARATGYSFHLYYALDTVGNGRNRRELINQAAEAAWNTPVKSANDLSGKLPIIPGMPIFITENIATELGLSNGSQGVLVSAKYQVHNNHRYLISVDVDIDSYNNPRNSYPHRVTLKPIKSTITYKLPGYTNVYTATRHQVPIIPAFAYTAHNSQGRSLNAACIDIASCPNIACAYVMLSRLRSLNNLSILRPFTFDKIHKHAPQEMRDELHRLDQLAEDTKSRAVTQLSWYYNLTEYSII